MRQQTLFIMFFTVVEEVLVVLLTQNYQYSNANMFITRKCPAWENLVKLQSYNQQNVLKVLKYKNLFYTCDWFSIYAVIQLLILMHQYYRIVTVAAQVKLLISLVM